MPLHQLSSLLNIKKSNKFKRIGLIYWEELSKTAKIVKVQNQLRLLFQTKQLSNWVRRSKAWPHLKEHLFKTLNNYQNNLLIKEKRRRVKFSWMRLRFLQVILQTLRITSPLLLLQNLGKWVKRLQQLLLLPFRSYNPFRLWVCRLQMQIYMKKSPILKNKGHSRVIILSH